MKLHRTTLYYRLRKIEKVLSVDLEDGSDRLALHLGLKLAWYPWYMRRLAERPANVVFALRQLLP